MTEQPLLGATLTQGQGQGGPAAAAGAQTALPRSQTPFAQKIQGLMQNPNFRAFMLNMSANLAAGNDFGTAIGHGGAGVGRAAAYRHDVETEERARQDALNAQKAGRRGGGGSRGGGGGSTASDLIGLGLSEKINRRQLVGVFEDTLEELQLASFADDMGREELKGLAWVEALSKAGNGAPAQLLAQIEDPSQRSQFLIDFSFGPEAGMQKLQETMQQGQAVLDEINGTQQPPVNTDAPGQPSGAVEQGPTGPGFITPNIALPQVPQVDGRGGYSLGDMLTGRSTEGSRVRRKRDPLQSDIPPP